MRALNRLFRTGYSGRFSVSFRLLNEGIIKPSIRHFLSVFPGTAVDHFDSLAPQTREVFCCPLRHVFIRFVIDYFALKRIV